ncbi:hypothetical protein PMIN02_012749 [Paraphaeosphaeria minitans]
MYQKPSSLRNRGDVVPRDQIQTMGFLSMPRYRTATWKRSRQVRRPQGQPTRLTYFNETSIRLHKALCRRPWIPRVPSKLSTPSQRNRRSTARRQCAWKSLSLQIYLLAQRPHHVSDASLD